MLDEDDMLNNTPKPSVVNLPNKITGASQLQSPERTKIQSTAADGTVGSSPRLPPFFEYSEESARTIICSHIKQHSLNTMKTNTQRKEIAEEELSEVSKHEIFTKGTPNKEGEAVTYESPSTLQGQSFPEESQGSHSESSSGSTSPETLHAQAPDLVPGGSEGNKVKRTSCIYGVNCYRKNPVHFQHFSHPGDCDYGGSEVLGGGETDDRPECPYGVSCYRKNPQHKVEYRHSILPEEDDGVGPPSECDLNDEECELTDEDSDWDPGKEDEEEEDVEELLQEAKKFMKGKK